MRGSLFTKTRGVASHFCINSHLSTLPCFLYDQDGFHLLHSERMKRMFHGAAARAQILKPGAWKKRGHVRLRERAELKGMADFDP